jgi:hypothetical protein
VVMGVAGQRCVWIAGHEIPVFTRTYLINGCTRCGLTSNILSELGVMESNYPFCGRRALVSMRIIAGEPEGTPNHVPVAGTCRISAAVGKVKWNVAPRPLFAVAHKRPPCDSTMERVMANPMPLPIGLVVKNAEKI